VTLASLAPEERELLEVVRRVAADRIAPRAGEDERLARFPREVFDELGQLGVLGLPFPVEVGGGGARVGLTLQVVEALAQASLAVGMGVSVHHLATWAIATFATEEQHAELVPDLVSGRLLGAYALSEPGAGSDAASLVTRAVRDGETYRLTGTKAWVTHGGVADRYVVMARTGDHGAQGISAFVLDADQPGLTVAAPERKMGLAASPTAQLHLDDAPVPASRLLGGVEGRGFAIAMAALDGGRLGIAACAVGLAQAALELAIDYAGTREQFGQPIARFQGVGFLLADMATRTEAARQLTLAAADLRDRASASGARAPTIDGHPDAVAITRAAAMSKLTATDAAMQTTSDAVQVLGGVGYTTDLPAERYLREAKVLQILEGTNQIQRVVIARSLTQPRS
jgi:alkylation response protein AidB-like acyl-CoA dehydrogenase